MGGYATIDRSRIDGNTVTAAGGDASATFAGMSTGNPGRPVTVSFIAHDRLTAATDRGTTTVPGGGIINLAGGSAPPTLNHSVITANQLASVGAGTPQGGGLYTTVPVVTRTPRPGAGPGRGVLAQILYRANRACADAEPADVDAGAFDCAVGFGTGSGWQVMSHSAWGLRGGSFPVSR
jgi:hypothetical protein